MCVCLCVQVYRSVLLRHREPREQVADENMEVNAWRLVGIGYEADYGNTMFRNLEFLLWLLKDLESYLEQINFVWRSVSVKLSPSL